MVYKPVLRSFLGFNSPFGSTPFDFDPARGALGVYDLGLERFTTSSPATTSTTHTAPGHHICWSHDPLADSDYNIDIGLLEMHGPDWLDYACTLGLPCALTLHGVGLNGSQGLRVHGTYDHPPQATRQQGRCRRENTTISQQGHVQWTVVSAAWNALPA